MKFQLYPVLQYIEYYLKKEDRHSLHSPFSYQIYQGLKAYYLKYLNQFPAIEQLRISLLQNNHTLTVRDFGAGSHQFSSPERKIKDIARYSCSTQKYSILYQHLCSLTPAQTVIELGTCLGLNTCYLGEITQGKLYSFEGADVFIDLVKKNLKSYKNIQLISGDISKTLPIFLENSPQIDFAFLDANHTYEHTMSYFNQIMERVHKESIVVIGDIHWSRVMNQAWRQLIASEQIRLSLDFYECGVLFFRDGLEKKHHILHY